MYHGRSGSFNMLEIGFETRFRVRLGLAPHLYYQALEAYLTRMNNKAKVR